MNLFITKKVLKPGLIIIFFLIISISYAWGEAEFSEKRSLSLEDYYRMESVGSPAVSPDGAWAAFERSFILEDNNRRHSEIWLAAADGSNKPFRLTSPAFSAYRPRWSPDGTLLVFSSSRSVPGEDDKTSTSVWFLRMDRPGGEAFQVEGVGGTPIFSPDNRWIAFTKETPPEPKPKKTYASDFERKIDERFKGRVYDWMNYRFDRRGYLPDPGDSFASPPVELYVVPRQGGTAKQLTRLDFDVSDVTWHPDSKVLAFIADSHQRDEYTYEMADLWTVTLDGQVKRLTNDGYHYSSPAWSPDGKAIVVLGEQGLDMVIKSKKGHSSPSDLYVISADGGSRQNLTVKWDLIPGAPSWSPDGKYIYFTSQIGGNYHLFRIPAKGEKVEQVTRGDRILYGFGFSSDFSRMVYVAADPLHPGGIFSALIDGSAETRLIQSNAELFKKIRLNPVERILYKSKDGTQIEGWIIYPDNYNPAKGPYPLILGIHGGPHAAYRNSFSFQGQLLAARGYFVLLTNPRGSTGYGEKFRWATWGGWGFLDYEDLMAGVDYMLKHYPIDKKHMGVTGASYGGFMTNMIIVRTQRFAAAVSRASISNWISDYGVCDIPRTKESEFFGPPWEKKSRQLLLKSSPIIYAGNVATPTLFLHGELDYRVPIEEAEQMYLALKKRRVPAKFIRYPDSYHGGWTPWRWLHSMYHELKWWEQYLEPGKTN
jgi:dipeptidyl aminopeptidase/acylaminoacyl peptidase